MTATKIYAPLEHVIAFGQADARGRNAPGPLIDTLHVFAVVAESPEYPEARISLAHEDIGSLSLTSEHAAQLEVCLASARADVDAALDSEQPLRSTAEVPFRCVCCGRMVQAGETMAVFRDERGGAGGSASMHWGPCVADDRHITIAYEHCTSTIPARVIGIWAMHRRTDAHRDGDVARDFSVTHVPSMRRLPRAFTRSEAWRVVKLLGSRCSGPEYNEFASGSEAWESAKRLVIGCLGAQPTSGVVNG